MFLTILGQIVAPTSILMMCIGVAAGIIIGAMPGLSGVFAISVLLPFTFGMDSVSGMYLLLGTFCGALFGGSISAILINTPGTPSACCTMIDGYPMAQQGRAADALKAALIASGFGGMFSSFVLIFLAPYIAKAAMNFASPEYFALCIFGLATIISVSGDNVVKGIIMAMLGLLLSTVGTDITDGSNRFIFGNFKLQAGIAPVIVMLGVFAFAEVLSKSLDVKALSHGTAKQMDIQKSTVKVRELLKYWKTMLKSSVIGTLIGAIPGTGAVISATLSYNEAKRSSKHPETFGKGEIEGVIAPEAGNNAVSGGALIPALTLGIPGDSSVAVLLGALTMQGITPGMALFTDDKVWVYAIMGGLFVINIIMVLQGLLFTRGFAKVAQIPEIILLPCIIVLCSVGAFAISGYSFNIILMMGFGVAAFILKRLDFPMPPMIVSMVLGSTMEANLRRSLSLAQGSASIFVTRPVSCIIIAVSLILLVSPFIKKLFAARKKAE